MVDFNQGETITTAPKDLLKIMILERWNNCIEAFESFDRRINKGYEGDTYELKARLKALFNILSSPIKKSDPKLFEELDISFRSISYESMLVIYNRLSDWLNDKELINVFTGKRYDSTRVEVENNAKGL